MYKIKRAFNAVAARPISSLNSFLQTYGNQNSLDSPKTQNLYFKSKIIVLIGLIFFATNILLSNLLIFNVENYNNFVSNSNKLDLYLDLNRRLFRSKEFLYQFKSFNTQLDYFSNYAKSILRSSAASSSHDSSNADTYQFEFNRTYAPAAYLNHLLKVYNEERDPENYLEENKIGFHWADWIDVTPALPFANAYQQLLKNDFNGDKIALQTAIHKICFDKLYDVKDKWVDDELYHWRTSVWEHLKGIEICASIYKYYYWPIPERILYETDQKYFKLPIKYKRFSKPLGLEGLTKVYYGTSHVNSQKVSNFINTMNRSEATNSLLNVAKEKNIIQESDPAISLKTTISQNPEDFKRPNFDEIYHKYKSIETKSKEEEKYFNFLEYSKNNVANANKFYFYFPWIKADSTAELHHYTFPWLNQIISYQERITVVHHLIRSWFKFAEQAGIISWFNYGNLIGWYFNSMNLPWDNDVDVQLSIKDLDKIGRFWNNTLVVEDPQHGDGLFWLQTNPYYLQQNDFQFIDARYIDTKTGIYIDLSALWTDDAPKPDHLKLSEGEVAFHCKHFNWFGYNEIFPIKRTLYEGAQAYMVNDVVSNLKKLYGEKPLTQKNEKNFNWQPDIGLWVPNDVCEHESIPKDRFDSDGQLTLAGACDNEELLETWRHTKYAWSLHQKEAALIKAGESTENLTAKSIPIFRHFNYEEYR